MSERAQPRTLPRSPTGVQDDALPGQLVRRGLLVLFFTWVTAILVNWTVLPFLRWGGLAFGLVAVDFDEFSLWTSWAPLAERVALGNPLPAATQAPGMSQIGFYPYLTVWLHGLAAALLGLDAAYAWGGLLFSLVAIALVTAVYAHYLPLRWSVSLAALGCIVFTNWPLRDFVASLLGGHGWRGVGAVASPPLVGFPFPGLTLSAFLAVLLLSLRLGAPVAGRTTLLTILWALQTQVHPVNAAVGLPFWFTMLALKLWRSRRQSWDRAATRHLLGQLALALVISAPAAYGVLNAGERSFALLTSAQGPTGAGGLVYYHLVYIGLPLLLLGLVAAVRRIDPYEIAVRFWPIWIMMAVYFLAMNSSLVLGVGIPRHVLALRLGIFFVHLFPYVPVIYFLLRPEQEPVRAPERVYPAFLIRKTLSWFFGPASKVYLPALFVLLTGYAFAGAKSHARFLEQDRIPAGRLLSDQVSALVEGASPGSTLMAPSPATNLAIPLAGDFGTLWVNRFAARVSIEEAIDRLALYGKLVGWSDADFERFVMPGREPIARPGRPIDLQARVSEGLGYWLLFHEKSLAPAELGALRARVSRRFRASDPARDLPRFHVTRVLDPGTLPSPVQSWLSRAARESRKTPAGTLYVLDGAGEVTR